MSTIFSKKKIKVSDNSQVHVIFNDLIDFNIYFIIYRKFEHKFLQLTRFTLNQSGSSEHITQCIMIKFMINEVRIPF